MNMPNDPVAIAIIRSVRPDQVRAFEAALHEWIPRSLEFPGHAGVLIVRPPEGGHEYGAFLRFLNADAWARFQHWPDYLAFIERIRPMLAHDPSTSVTQGLESWVDAGKPNQPIRWRMALVTFVAVNVLVYASMKLVAAVGPGWPFWVGFLVTNAIVVVSLAWVVMPLATRWLRTWLEGGRR
jgi:uncharacterized protein